jgi:cytochrome P450
MSMGTVPSVDIDFADPVVNHSPYVHVKRIREAGPVVFNGAINRWLAGGFDAARKMLLDGEMFPPDRVFYDTSFGARVFEADDNPRHNETRGIWDQYFRPAAVEKLRPLMEQVTDDRIGVLASQLRAGEVVDFVSGYAKDMPTRLITRLLGIPEENRAEWQRYAMGRAAVKKSLLGTDRASLAKTAGADAIRPMCEAAGRELARRRETGDVSDLIGILAHSPVAETMTEAEQRSMIALIFTGGHDTTAKLVSNSLVMFARHPEQRQAIVEDRSLLPQAIKEVLRFEPSIGMVTRSVREDCEFGGVSLPGGALAGALLFSAHRDPQRWDDPDTFDIFRPYKPGIPFGFGTHACLGQNIAQANGELVLNRILDLIPQYQIVETDDEIDYGTDWLARGPVALHLKL